MTTTNNNCSVVVTYEYTFSQLFARIIMPIFYDINLSVDIVFLSFYRFTNLWLNRMMKFWFLFDASFIFNVVYKKDVSKLDNSRTKLLKPAFEVSCLF